MTKTKYFTPESLKEGFRRLEKEPLKVSHGWCGRCFSEIGTNKDCDICRGIMDWMKDETKKQNKKN
jgi:hypothetical protein